MSSLPKHVQEGLDQATAIQNKLAGGAQQPTPAEPQPQPKSQAEPQPKSQAEPQPQPEPQPKDDEATWEQRYKSYKGTGDRLFEENKRLTSELERASRYNEQLAGELDKLKEQVEKLANPPEPEPEPPKGATEEDVESFGADMVSFVTRVAMKAAADQIMVLEAKIQGLMSGMEEMRGEMDSVNTRSTMTAEQLFLRDLANAVPDYLQINASQEWRDWLQEFDRMSGKRRQELLSDAQRNLDVDRVAGIFNTFKHEHGGDAAATTSPASQVVDPLESRVSPPRSKTTQAASAQPDGQPRIWTQAEIAEVYNRGARGKIGAEEFKALEMEINQAVRQGRVVRP